ncbi:hypothetical protein Q787_05095 [Ornithobacterium rhinotracheale H06-030791]|nr:hypothetical protein Q785_05220 [Ornithobacterium rhinotracheale ORT-UMN 88]KGB67432.1 hypothetical protein Q787_05095 [Ornithobacterium rhinotracheale H06-030791]
MYSADTFCTLNIEKGKVINYFSVVIGSLCLITSVKNKIRYLYTLLNIGFVVFNLLFYSQACL